MITWSCMGSLSSIYLQTLPQPVADQALDQFPTHPGAAWQVPFLLQHQVRTEPQPGQVLRHLDRRPLLSRHHHQRLLSTEQVLRQMAQTEQDSARLRIVKEDYQLDGNDGRIIWVEPTTWTIILDQLPGTDHQQLTMNEINEQRWRRICRWKGEHIRIECFPRIEPVPVHLACLSNRGVRQPTRMLCQ